MATQLATVNEHTGEITMQGAGAQMLSATAEAERSRMIAEIQARVIVAQRNPRDERQAIERIKLAFMRPRLAAVGMYAYPRGGEQISGLSIRAAEALALGWRNVAFGTRELERNVEAHTSQALSYAWDLEANVLSELSFEIAHIRDSKRGGKQIVTEERDIYEVVANMGSRRKRACILGILPFDVKEEAEDQIEATMKANVDIKPETIAKLLAGFTSFGVSKDAIQKRLQRSIDSITPAQVIHLRRIWASLKDGVSGPEEWFELEPTIEQQNGATKTQTIAADLAAKVQAAKHKPGNAGQATIDADDTIAMMQQAQVTVAQTTPATKPAASVPGIDFSTMTSDQLRDYVEDIAAASKVPEAYLKNVILRAHASEGITPGNIGLVLSEIDKRAKA